MDAAGKDGTIEHVMSGLNPQGVRVTSFKQPTQHRARARLAVALPARAAGARGDRHLQPLALRGGHRRARAPGVPRGPGDRPGAADRRFWKERYEAIAAWERHLHRSGTRVVKFFLHVSRDEQRERFLARAAEPEKNWKFSAGDVAEREHWDDYQSAFEAALRATSTKDAPWYVIPADHKWLMRTAVAAILVHHLEAMDPRFPEPSDEERAAMAEAVARLRDE